MGLTRLQLVLLASLLSSAARAEPFLREDWVISAEPTHPDHFGINHWGVTNFDLPYRGVQRGKHHLENKYADNWRFRTETGGLRGIGMRTASTLLDFALFVGPQNFDHVMGHDSRARELSRDYPGSHRYVSKRFSQVLPVYFGGKELQSPNENITNGNGADLSTLTNSTLWEMRNQFFYFSAKRIMAEERANSTQLENLIFQRLFMLQTQWKAVDQVCATARANGGTTPMQCLGDGGGAADWSNYLMDLNTGRYGVANVGDYKLKTADLQRANQLQFVDPVFLVAAYRYGADYLGHARNQSRLPMIPLAGSGVSYLPGLRVDLSPFGIEYIQDNYFRYRRTLVNLFWTRGDNKYEKRLGAGFDVDNLPLWRGVTAGVYGQLYKQPLVSRIIDRTPLSASEVGVLHNVYHYGASLRVPLRTFGDPANPKQVILTLKAGRKNTGWIPGEYIKGSTYVETGLGFHL
ncbi:MAG: hypothetical protein ABL955_00320 [Elusimicrobiota bacterium]